MEKGNLPSFICIGAMKCGTSSLHRYLGEHPEVIMSNPKETDFFLERNDKSLEWYRKCFKGKAKKYGEISPNYTKYPLFKGVPNRVHKVLPDVKLIYLVRDPVERAISNYVHNWARMRVSSSIDENFQPVEKCQHITNSRYFYQIRRYLKKFPRKNIRIFQSENLRKNRQSVMKKIFEFINVKKSYECKGFEEEYHKSRKKEVPNRLVMMTQESNLMREIKHMVKKLLPKKTYEKIRNQMWSKVEKKPKLSKDVLCKVKEYLKSDVERLRSLTGKDFHEWSI